MKPLGMSPTFELCVPSPAEDAIWDAVEAAIAAGWTAAQFRREAANAWEQLLKQAAHDARKELEQ